MEANMAQKREKDETMELTAPPADAPLSLSCPDNCKIPTNLTTGSGPDPAWMDPGSSEKAEPSRSDKVEEQQEREHQVPVEAETTAQGRRSGGGEAAAKRAVNRCSGCGKRVGLTGFRCRCGDLFCWEHRYSDRHDCSFDYKAAGREAIARENPVVRAPKILKV